MLGKATLNLVNGSLRALTVPLKTPRMCGKALQTAKHHSHPARLPEPKKAAECQCERDRKPSWSRSRFVPPRNALSVRNAKARSSTLAVCPKRVVGGLVKSTVHADEGLLRRSDTLTHRGLSHLTSVFPSLSTCYQ